MNIALRAAENAAQFTILDGLVAYFVDGELKSTGGDFGNLVDQVGHDTPYPYGYTFDGADGYGRLTSSLAASDSDLTMFIVASVPDLVGTKRIAICHETEGTSTYIIDSAVDGASLRARVTDNTGASQYATNGTIEANKRFSQCLVLSNRTLSNYVNGVNAGDATQLANATKALEIVTMAATGSLFTHYNVTINTVLIYDRALQQNEVEYLHNIHAGRYSLKEV